MAVNWSAKPRVSKLLRPDHAWHGHGREDAGDNHHQHQFHHGKTAA